METLFEIWKRAQNSYSNRRSTGCFSLRRLAPGPFRPHFLALSPVLVEAIPPFADMLRSFGPRRNLCGTTQIVRRQSPGPSVVRWCLNCTTKNLSRPKARAWANYLKKFAEQALTPRKVFPSCHHNGYMTKHLNRPLNVPTIEEQKKGMWKALGLKNATSHLLQKTVIFSKKHKSLRVWTPQHPFCI